MTLIEKNVVSVKSISVFNVIKNWRSMAHTVFHAHTPMCHRSVTIATRE